VIVGTAVGEKSAARGHYYAGPGNEMWRFLHDEAGLTSVRLSPERDHELPRHGIGLTDLVKDLAGRVSLVWPHCDGLIWPHLRHAGALL